MDNKGSKDSKFKLSKRAVLYLANGVFFVAMVIFLFLPVTVHRLGNSTISIILLIIVQCVFTFFSLIVYYLSIITDAIGKRYKDRMAEEEKKPKTK